MLQDFLGKEITAGCEIVYPVRQGSNMWFNSAIVLDVSNGLHVLPKGRRRPLTLGRPERCVIVTWPEPQPTIGYGQLGTKASQLGVGSGTVQ